MRDAFRAELLPDRTVRVSRTGVRSCGKVIGAGLSEGEREDIDAGIEKLDVERAIADRRVLP